MKKYKFYGHGWLAVKIQELIELKIADKITKYSYMRGKTAYLEEDCDANLFIDTAKIKNEQIDGRTFDGNSPIRSYSPFKKDVN